MKIAISMTAAAIGDAKNYLDAFCRRSGIFFVSSGRLSNATVHQRRDCLEFEAYFDSRAWTGLA